MNHFSGYVKLTHKYTAGWDYLDDRRYVGEFRVLSRKRVDTDPKRGEMPEPRGRTTDVHSP